MTYGYDPKNMRQRLMQALEERGISMRKASLDAGFSETFVHGIIKLGRDPGIDNLTKLCETHGISLSYIIFGHEISAEAEEILVLFQEKPSRRQAILELLRG